MGWMINMFSKISLFTQRDAYILPRPTDPVKTISKGTLKKIMIHTVVVPRSSIPVLFIFTDGFSFEYIYLTVHAQYTFYDDYTITTKLYLVKNKDKKCI